jgi:hypothetical protein
MRIFFNRTVSAVAVLAIAIALGGVASAATSSVTLKLKGEYSKRARGACGKRERFRLYHRRSTIEYRGVLTPHPAKHFGTLLELKRCSGGRFRDFHSYRSIGKKLTGKYKGFLSARGLAPRSHRANAIVYYFARVVAGGARSRKVFFAVTG